MTTLLLNRGGFGRQQTWSRDLGGRDGSAITVLNGHSRGSALRDGAGRFSIKWIPRGRTVYRTGGISHRLAGRKALILNPGQPYDLEFAEGPYSETLCVFYSEDLVHDAWTSLTDPEGAAEGRRDRTVEFPDVVFTPATVVLEALEGLHANFNADDPAGRLDEGALLLLLGRLVRTAESHRLDAGGLPALRASTRRDLLARLLRARDMIDDAPAAAPSLDALARESALSKFHLLRLFKAAFGLTPASYAARARIRRAMTLLADTSRSLDRIADDLGLESASSLVRAFRRETGTTPGAWRNRNIG